MTKKTKLILVAIIAIVIVILVSAFFLTLPQENAPTPQSPDHTSADIQKHVEVDGEKALSQQETRKIIDKIADDRFGEDAFVIFLSTEGPSEIEIDGIKRSVHIYAADSSSAHSDGGKVRGLYHVDVHSGEVFDNGSGTMEKVIIGE